MKSNQHIYQTALETVCKNMLKYAQWDRSDIPFVISNWIDNGISKCGYVVSFHQMFGGSFKRIIEVTFIYENKTFTYTISEYCGHVKTGFHLDKNRMLRRFPKQHIKKIIFALTQTLYRYDTIN